MNREAQIAERIAGGVQIRWKVGEVPTGRYRSFSKRGWPMASYMDGRPAAAIYCEDEYRSSNVVEGKHELLTLNIADHSRTPWKWVKSTTQYKTLQEAKDAAQRFLVKFPNLVPKDLQ